MGIQDSVGMGISLGVTAASAKIPLSVAQKVLRKKKARRKRKAIA